MQSMYRMAPCQSHASITTRFMEQGRLLQCLPNISQLFCSGEGCKMSSKRKAALYLDQPSINLLRRLAGKQPP